jgi:hypothetical protein
MLVQVSRLQNICDIVFTEGANPFSRVCPFDFLWILVCFFAERIEG